MKKILPYLRWSLVVTPKWLIALAIEPILGGLFGLTMGTWFYTLFYWGFLNLVACWIASGGGWRLVVAPEQGEEREERVAPSDIAESAIMLIFVFSCIGALIFVSVQFT